MPRTMSYYKNLKEIVRILYSLFRTHVYSNYCDRRFVLLNKLIYNKVICLYDLSFFKNNLYLNAMERGNKFRSQQTDS